MRASLLGELGGGVALAGSYAEGIAQPTFFDLYGFFPGNFVGNPSLRPERSTGFEASLRFRRERFAASLTAFRQRLKDEIVETFDFDTFLSSTENRTSASRRRGIEAELAWQPSDALRLSANYAYLKASQPDNFSGSQLEEHRRPRHSGALQADGAVGRWSYGGSLAYVGSRLDREEVGNRAIVRLSPYWLASARVAYALTPALQLFVRGSNLLDDRYEDFGRLPDRGSRAVRRDQSAGGSAIIAVNCASAASFPATLARPENLQMLERFWTNSTSSWSRQPGSTGTRNFAPSMAMK